MRGVLRLAAGAVGGPLRLLAAPPKPRCCSRQLAVAAAATFSTRGAPPPVPIVYHPLYSAPDLAPGHQFPMKVFGRIHGRLLRTGVILESQVHVPPALPTDEELALVHCPDYLRALSSCSLDEARVRRCRGVAKWGGCRQAEGLERPGEWCWDALDRAPAPNSLCRAPPPNPSGHSNHAHTRSLRRIGFREATSTPLLVERTKAEVAGTLLTAELALRRGLALNTAGGTHHAFRDYGSVSDARKWKRARGGESAKQHEEEDDAEP